MQDRRRTENHTNGSKNEDDAKRGQPVEVFENSIRISNLEVAGPPFEVVRTAADQGEQPEQTVRRMLGVGADIMIHGANKATVDSVSAEVDRLIGGFGTLTATELPKIFDKHQASLERVLSERFDGKRKSSVQHEVSEIIRDHLGSVTEELGKQLSRSGGPLDHLKAELSGKLSVMASRQDEVLTQVAAVGERIRSNEALAAEHERGTAKGLEYEDAVEAALDWCFSPFGETVLPVGSREGSSGTKKGDFIVTVSGHPDGSEPASIVVEAKATKLSKPAALKELDAAIENRDAFAGILVFSSQDQAPTNGRSLRVMDGGRILTVYDPRRDGLLSLECATQIARAFAIRSQKSPAGQLDYSALEADLARLTQAVDDAKAIKRGVVAARKGLGQVEDSYESLRNKATEAILNITRLLGQSTKEAA